MNKIKKLLIAVILSLGILPSIVSAATANFSISAPSQGIVGNNITVTVTISSSTSLGSWEMALSYDKSYLQLSSAPEGANGTKVADTHKSAGNKTKTYTYKFKVLKSGTTTISTTSTDAYDWDFNVLSCSNGSKKITLKTQAEIEASYSSDAYLKSLGVTGYTLTPEFDKKVNEYSLEVENDVEKVTITGAKNDSNATVSGLGEKELKEGTNKFNIVVTAQKGNSLTYVVSVTRKELNPIEVNVKGKKYFVVRKKADVPEVTMFTDTTAVYGEDEIPALYNEALNYTLIALKDEDGNIKPFIYKDGKVEDEYIVITTNTTTIIPIGINEEKSKLKVVDIVIKDHLITGLAFKNTSKQVVIKGKNVANGEEGIYLYDLNNNTFVAYSLDDLSIIDEMSNELKDYKMIIIVLGAVILLLIILLIIKKPSKKDKKKNNEDLTDIEEIKEEVKEEIKEELVEEIKEEEKPKKNKKRKAKEEVPEEIIPEEIVVPQEEVKVEEKQEIIVEEKKKKDKKKKKKEEIKEEVKEEKKDTDDEIDDPLNHDDNFVDFWN